MIGNGIKTGVLSVVLASMGMGTGCYSGLELDDIEDRNAEIVANLIDAGFSEDEIEIREAVSVDEDGVLGVPTLQVFVDEDTHVTLEASRELVDAEGNDFRHWRTPNIVNKNKKICLGKVVTAAAAYSSYKLTGRMKDAVNKAKNNYNALNNFSLSFKVGDAHINNAGQLTHSIGGCDYIIYVYKVEGGPGGSAGFPSGGAPYNQIRLNSGLAGWSKDVHEHVVTHEIGHAIGMRHTDWKTRSSCGGAHVNEGKMGASRINNTPGQTTNSIMASCFSESTDGEFRGDDAKAFRKLY